MKKGFLGVQKLLILAFLLSPLTVFAVEGQPTLLTNTESTSTTTTSSQSEPNKTEVRSRLKEIKDRRALTAAERQQKITELKTARVEARCRLLKTNIQARQEFYATNKERYIARYNQLATNIENAIARLKSLGYTTTKLETELKELQSLISDLRAKYAELLTAFAEMEAKICLRKEGEKFAPAVNAQKYIGEMRTITQKIKTQMQEGVLPALREVKSQKPQSSSSSSSSTSSAITN